jgi:hypothetical protein
MLSSSRGSINMSEISVDKNVDIKNKALKPKSKKKVNHSKKKKTNGG